MTGLNGDTGDGETFVRSDLIVKMGIQKITERMTK